MMGPRTAVVGGGIFGVTAAVELARRGHSVVLFERATKLLSGASSGNQRRLHHGYHYPRGIRTATAAHKSAKSFAARYRSAIYRKGSHYVAIAKEKSLVTVDQYIAFCTELGLRYREEYPPFLRRSSVEVCLRVAEHLIDIDLLRELCTTNLAAAGVRVRLRTRADSRLLRSFDHVVLATYASLNQLRIDLGCPPDRYQFELCEKPVVRLPVTYQNTSLVIMDGPFFCVDPIAGTDDFLLGNVDHAILATTIGHFPLIPRPILEDLDNGVVTSPKVTRFAEFIASAKDFLIGFEQAEHLGSMFTVRAVLPDMEKTDDRPTLIQRVDDRTVALFGGKIANCVDAAGQIADMLTGSTPVSVES